MATTAKGRKADRSKVSANQDYELAYEAKKLGTTKERIKRAIKSVGNDRAKIEAWIKRYGG